MYKFTLGFWTKNFKQESLFCNQAVHSEFYTFYFRQQKIIGFNSKIEWMYVTGNTNSLKSVPVCYFIFIISIKNYPLNLKIQVQE